MTQTIPSETPMDIPESVSPPIAGKSIHTPGIHGGFEIVLPTRDDGSWNTGFTYRYIKHGDEPSLYLTVRADGRKVEQIASYEYAGPRIARTPMGDRIERRSDARRIVFTRHEGGETITLGGEVIDPNTNPRLYMACRARIQARFQRAVAVSQHGHSLGAWISETSGQLQFAGVTR